MLIPILSTSKFLSTPSARRATRLRQPERHEQVISIHALCEEGDKSVRCFSQELRISIHALCEEGDTGDVAANEQRRQISIHALCEEGDLHRVV